MNIGEATRLSGVPAKLIRYYESTSLIAPAERNSSGYRVYTMRDVHTLCFIKRARNLGFSVGQIHQLLALWHDESRKSAEVKRLALSHIAELEAKIEDLHSIVETLRSLAESCMGDSRPDCPILDEIAQVAGDQKPAAPAKRRERLKAPAKHLEKTVAV